MVETGWEHQRTITLYKKNKYLPEFVLNGKSKRLNGLVGQPTDNLWPNFQAKINLFLQECTNHNLHPDNVPMLIVGNKYDGNNEDVIAVQTNIAQR